jgi:hypothetical protein
MKVYSPNCYIGYTGTIALPFSSVQTFVTKIQTPRPDTRITYLVYTPGVYVPGSTFTHFQPGSTYEITSPLPSFGSFTIPVCGSRFEFPQGIKFFSGLNSQIGNNYITYSPFAQSFPLSSFDSFINFVYIVNPIGNNGYIVYRPSSIYKNPLLTSFEPGSSYNVQVKQSTILPATPTPTQTPTISQTPTNTPTNTQTPSQTPTNTNTPTQTPTQSPTPSKTPTNTPTSTQTPTQTQTPTPTTATISLCSTVCVTGAGEDLFNTFYSRNANINNGRYYVGYPKFAGFVPYLVYSNNIYSIYEAGWVIQDSTGLPFYYNITNDNTKVPLTGWQTAPYGEPAAPVINLGPCATPTPTPTPTSTPSQTPSRTPTQTPTRTPAATTSPTSTPTPSPTKTATPTPTQTITPSSSPIKEPPDGFAVLSYIYFNSTAEMELMPSTNTANYGNGIIMTDLGNGTYRSLNVWAENSKSILNLPTEIPNHNGSYKGLYTTSIAYGGKNCNSFYSAMSSFTVYFNRYTGIQYSYTTSVAPAHGFFNIVFDSDGNPVINNNSSRAFPSALYESSYGDKNGNTIIHVPGGGVMRSCIDKTTSDGFAGIGQYSSVKKYDVTNCNVPAYNYNLYGGDTYLFVNSVNQSDKMGMPSGFYQNQSFIGVLPSLGNYSTYGSTNNFFIINLNNGKATTTAGILTYPGCAVRISIHEITGGSGSAYPGGWVPTIRNKALYQSGLYQWDWLYGYGQGVFSDQDPANTRAVQPSINYTWSYKYSIGLKPAPVEGSLACLPDRYDYYFSTSIQCGARPAAGYAGQQAGYADKDKIVTYNIKSYDNVAALPEVDALPWPNPKIPEVQCHKNVSSCINPVNGFPIIAFREVGAPIGRGNWNSTPDGFRLMYYNGSQWLNWNGTTTLSRFWTRTATDRLVPTQYPGYIKVLCNKTGTKIWTYFILNSFVGYNIYPNNPNYGPGGKYDSTYTNAKHLNSGIYKITFTGSVAGGYSPGSIETVVAPTGNRVITQLEAKNQFLR